MYDIKELVWEEHKNAERQEFVKTLMSGEINAELYATYLYNQLQCYAELEKWGNHNGLFRQTPGLQRAENIHKDYTKLWTKSEKPIITQSTKEYVEHINTITDDPEKLYAHIYVRHLGDLSGGQMIAKKVPAKRYYDFGANGQEWKRIVKEIINNYLNAYEKNVVPEAKLCFNFATRLFREMNDLSYRNTENDPFKGTSMEGKD
jgi:heme oxygenase (biliverdin-producing, ferredoxin)